MDSENQPVNSLKQGIGAAIEEDWETARRFLWQAVTENPRNEVAWMWLAKVSENLDEHQFSLAQALALNPENRRARSELETSRADPEAAGRPAARGWCLICGLGFAQESTSCARCRCVTELDDPKVFLQPLEVERGLVRKILKRLDGASAMDQEERLRVLALARLNLGELCEALSPLEALERLVPGDATVKAMIATIREQLSGIQIESGFETEVVDRPAEEDLDAV